MSPDDGIEAVSKSQIAEADKGQPAFHEVDLGGMRSRDLDDSADKGNVPPSSFNYGSKRLMISPVTNESTTSISRAAKVSVM